MRPFETSFLSAVKCYSRSAAGQSAARHKNIRDLTTLENTVKYLFEQYRQKSYCHSFLLLIISCIFPEFLIEEKHHWHNYMTLYLTDWGLFVKIWLSRAIWKDFLAWEQLLLRKFLNIVLGFISTSSSGIQSISLYS